MLKKTAVVLLFVLLSLSRPAFARSPVSPNVDISIQKVETGYWTKPRHHMVNDWVDRTGEDEKLSYVAVTYQIANNDETRKFDLEQNLDHRLKDEFGNEYRQMKKPDDYDKPVLKVSKNFPSLYPGETYGETLFFEAPVARAKDVRLFLNARSLGITTPVELPLAVVGNGVKQCPVKKLVKNEYRKPEPSTVEIVSPSDGLVVEPGQVVHLQVTCASAPDMIVVIGFDTTYEDKAPLTSNIYDINIPRDQRGGEYPINVIAWWGDGSGDNGVSSDSLSLLVKDL